MSSLEKRIREIDQVVSLNENIAYENLMADETSSSAMEYVKVLKELGWKIRKTHSQCSKATYQEYLKKNGIYADIVAANFLGSFVQVEFWPK